MNFNCKTELTKHWILEKKYGIFLSKIRLNRFLFWIGIQYLQQNKSLLYRHTGFYNLFYLSLFIYYRSLYNHLGHIQNLSECNYPIPGFHRDVSSLAFQVIANHIPFSLYSIFNSRKFCDHICDFNKWLTVWQ